MDVHPSSPAAVEAPTLSKNQLKKLKRDEEWEANRAKRKAKRKEKHKEKKQRKRAAREGLAQVASIIPSPATDGRQESQTKKERKADRPQTVQLPITLVLDCGFDNLMSDKERKSLGSQVTRCYSDNHKAPFQAHLAVSSFGGPLKERFEGILEGHHHSWKNVRFMEDDFVKVGEQAKEWMRGACGGRLAGVFANMGAPGQPLDNLLETGEVMYLTSDSPNTITQLRPYSTYIIGGIVDHNRHKGICFKRAMDRGIKTAKLPIGNYMNMTSRKVLATSHVNEIMLRWLELGDWAKAFELAIPKRKGGVLKSATEDTNGEPVGKAFEGELDTKGHTSGAPRDFPSETESDEDKDEHPCDEDLEPGGVPV